MKSVEKRQDMESDMSTGEIVAVAVGVVVVAAIAFNLKDLIRYIKISSM